MRLLLASLALSFCITQAEAAPAAKVPPVIRVPILVYHHIRETKPYPKSTWSYKMSVSPKVFKTQMQWISDHGYTTVSMDTAVDILTGTEKVTKKPIVITFDDNDLTAYTEGFPILKKNKQVAVFYLITNRLGNDAFINSVRAKELSDAGMDIESHTVTHSTLTALPLKKLDRELTESKAALEKILGTTVKHVAYPSTAHNKTVRQHTKDAGYVTGTIMDPRAATSKDDLMKLPRIMMTDDTNLKKLLP